MHRLVWIGTIIILIIFLAFVQYKAFAYEYDFFEIPYGIDYVDSTWTNEWEYCWNCPPIKLIIIDDDDGPKIAVADPDEPGNGNGPPCVSPPCGPPDTPGNGNGNGPPCGSPPCGNGPPDDKGKPDNPGNGNGNGPPDNSGNGKGNKGGNDKGKGKGK